MKKRRRLRDVLFEVVCKRQISVSCYIFKRKKSHSKGIKNKRATEPFTCDVNIKRDVAESYYSLKRLNEKLYDIDWTFLTSEIWGKNRYNIHRADPSLWN
jgi:hypothetical protein